MPNVYDQFDVAAPKAEKPQSNVYDQFDAAPEKPRFDASQIKLSPYEKVQMETGLKSPEKESFESFAARHPTETELKVAKFAPLATTPEKQAQLGRMVAQRMTPALPTGFAAADFSHLQPSLAGPPPTPAPGSQEAKMQEQGEKAAAEMEATLKGTTPKATRTAALAKGTAETTSGLVEFFRSPVGLGALFGSTASFVPAAIQRGISLMFAGQMASQLPGEAKELLDEIKKPDNERDYEKIGRVLSSGVANALFSTIATAHGLSSGKTITPQTDYAKTVRSDTGQVRPTGTQPEILQGQGRPDLQQPAPGQPQPLDTRKETPGQVSLTPPEPTPEQFTKPENAFVSKGVARPSISAKYFHDAGPAAHNPDWWVNFFTRHLRNDFYNQETAYQIGLYLRQLGDQNAGPVVDALQQANTRIREIGKKALIKFAQATTAAEKNAIGKTTEFKLTSIAQYPREAIETAYNELSARGIIPETHTKPLSRMVPAVPPEAPPVAADTMLTDTELFPISEVPVSEIALSKEVPNFKSDADPETGVVPGERLAGTYERLGTAPIVVWERLDGSKEVITGRHRLDLARRTSEKTIPAQVVREADGFTKDKALIFDAESNIRDGQGSLEDYAHYFKNTQISEAEARARGLLSRVKGDSGWHLGRNASDDLYSIWQAGKVATEKAVAIAKAAPGDANLQALGIKQAFKGRSETELTNFIRAVASQTGGIAEQVDLFGRDDRAIKLAEEMAKRASEQQKSIADEIRAVQNAAKNPTLAAKHGVDVKDPQGVLKKVSELKAQLDRWQNWSLHPDLVALVGGKPPKEVAPLAPAEQATEQARLTKELGQEEEPPAEAAPTVTPEPQKPSATPTVGPEKSPAMMTPEEYDKYEKTLPAQNRDFVAAADNEFNVALYGLDAATWRALKAGQPTLPENVTNMKAAAAGRMATQKEMAAAAAHATETRRPWLNGWTIPELKADAKKFPIELLKKEALRMGANPKKVKSAKTREQILNTLEGAILGQMDISTKPSVLAASHLPPKIAPAAPAESTAKLLGQPASYFEEKNLRSLSEVTRVQLAKSLGLKKFTVGAIRKAAATRLAEKSETAPTEPRPGPEITAGAEPESPSISPEGSKPIKPEQLPVGTVFHVEGVADSVNFKVVEHQTNHVKSQRIESGKPDRAGLEHYLDIVEKGGKLYALDETNVGQPKLKPLAILEKGPPTPGELIPPQQRKPLDLTAPWNVRAKAKAAPAGELFPAAEVPFNLAGEATKMVAPKVETTAFGGETLSQNELFGIQEVVKEIDPGKSANAAQRLAGGDPAKAAAMLRRQVRVMEADPKSYKAYGKEQRARLKEVIALLDQRAGGKGDIIGMGGAVASEFEHDPRTPTSIKNAVVDQERQTRGLPPAIEPARRAFGTVWDEAMAQVDRDPGRQDELIAELRDKPRALTDTEDALLLHRQIDLQNEFGKGARDMAQAHDDGRLDDVEEHKIRLARISDQLLDIYNIGKRVGTETGRGLNARKMLAFEDFTLAQMTLEKRIAKGGAPLTEPEQADIAKQQADIATKQKAADEQAIKQKSQQDETAIDEGIKTQIRKAQGEASTAKRTGRKRDIGSEHNRIVKGMTKRLDEGMDITDLGGWIQKLARLFVEQGVTEREALVDAVHEVVADLVPDFTRRDTMDAISGYGQFKQLSKDEISVTLRDLKGQMQQVAKLQDIMAKEPPLKTGLERRTPSDEERRLIKLVNDAKRRFGIVVTDPARQLQTALGARKTYYRNQIADLEAQIAQRQKFIKERAPSPTDAELEQLKGQRDELKKQFDTIFPKPAKTNAELLAALKKRLQDRIENYETRLAEKDFAARPRRQIPLDKEALRLQAEAERAKEMWRRGLIQDRLANRSGFEKGLDRLVKWRQAFVISGIRSLFKLASATIEGMVLLPIREAVGAGLGQLPFIRQVAARAPSEGGLNLRIEARALAETYSHLLSDFGKNLRGEKPDFEQVYGPWRNLPPELANYVGFLHGALKSPLARNVFTRSFAKRAEFAARHGTDISDPLVQMEIGRQAWEDSSFWRFQNRNLVVSLYRQMLARLQTREKATGQPAAGRKALAVALQVEFPIVTVPSNILARTFESVFGSVLGSVRLTKAIGRGIENLDPQQADLIMRNLKTGSLGLALTLLGYLTADQVGGYYQQGKKQKPGAVPYGAVRMWGTDIPSVLLHNPFLEAVQFGATIRHVADGRMKKSAKETNGKFMGLVEAIVGSAEQQPFVRESFDLARLQSTAQAQDVMGENLRSLVVPMAIQWIAEKTDEGVKRQPKTILQHVEMGIPGLRGNVPRQKKKYPATR